MVRPLFFGNTHYLHSTIHALAYNLVNWMRRLVFPMALRKWRMETIRLRLIKVASKVACHGRSIMYRLCSSFPYKKEFVTILDNISEFQILCG